MNENVVIIDTTVCIIIKTTASSVKWDMTWRRANAMSSKSVTALVKTVMVQRLPAAYPATKMPI